mmetsp:Transcript_21599/g.42871  ORF Transcript_21599/g.42871 Transcript_21599/m.42871 type:complete len:211 (-) Transcript_21599:787-1419(-)
MRQSTRTQLQTLVHLAGFDVHVQHGFPSDRVSWIHQESRHKVLLGCKHIPLDICKISAQVGRRIALGRIRTDRRLQVLHSLCLPACIVRPQHTQFAQPDKVVNVVRLCSCCCYQQLFSVLQLPLCHKIAVFLLLVAAVGTSLRVGVAAACASFQRQNSQVGLARCSPRETARPLAAQNGLASPPCFAILWAWLHKKTSLRERFETCLLLP